LPCRSRYLPDVELEWRDVALGAFSTALLFALGQYLIGLYLGLTATSSSYGAAGSVVLLLLWVYYSAQVFLIGAEFTRLHADHRGKIARPEEYAEPCDPPGRRDTENQPQRHREVQATETQRIPATEAQRAQRNSG
jgi:membrane protein